MMGGHKLLASIIVSRAPLIGIEPFQASRLSGVVADFISGLLTLDPKHPGGLYEVAEFLEQNLARGCILLEAAKFEYPDIFYELGGQRVPLHLTSSMVSELAPLVLFLKYKVQPGDLLIIEEPESHLHPANQRILARAVVKMIRKGLRVMLTTHSDYFLSQLSNFVRLSQLPEQRTKQGYDEDDYLNPEDVSAYLFDLDEEQGGSVIRPLQVDAENGIDEEALSDVAESLYNEFVDLERARIE